MIINFNDLRIPFHRLAPGTILIDPDDIRYMKLDITQEAINELYPDYSKDYDCPQYVAEAIIYDWMNKS